MKYTLSWLTAVCLLFVIGEVSAQLPPPISPWMSMFQRRTGPLDNYNSYVRPMQNAQRTFQQQQQEIMQNQQAVQQLQQGAQNIQGSNGGGVTLAADPNRPLDPNLHLLAPPRLIPCGNPNAAYYSNYYHYYQIIPMSRAPMFSQPGANRRR